MALKLIYYESFNTGADPGTSTRSKISSQNVISQFATVTKCQIKLHEKPSLVPVLSCFLSSTSAFSELTRPESYENIEDK